MARPLEHIYVEYNGQDTKEFDSVIAELREKYGEDCKLILDIDVFSQELACSRKGVKER